MTEQNISTHPRFIKLDVTAEKVGMGKSTVLAWEATGRFPRAVRLSPTLRVWLEADVDRWILERHANNSTVGSPLLSTARQA
jgi:prophage regulatory protein